MMYISYSVLFIICFACLSLGACLGMIVMVLCQVSGECSRNEEARQSKTYGAPFDM